MAKNLSRMYGVPTSEQSAKKQHEELVDKLKHNHVFFFQSQNRGYLALENATGQYKEKAFFNILYNTKPNKKGIIKVTKI